jgi:hypothetical protein
MGHTVEIDSKTIDRMDEVTWQTAALNLQGEEEGDKGGNGKGF